MLGNSGSVPQQTIMTIIGVSSWRQGSILVLHFWVKGSQNTEMEVPNRKTDIHDWSLGEETGPETDT